MKITINPLDKKSIIQAIKDVNQYKRELKPKMLELCKRAAEIGAEEADISYASVSPWQSTEGYPQYDVEVVPKKNGYAIQASGEDVLFLEFGAGARYGYGHPYSGDEMGMVVEGADAPYGPGTWPEGVGHWDDPRGWYLPKRHGIKSYGNPPAVGMYDAKVEIERNLEKLKEEIFDG